MSPARFSGATDSRLSPILCCVQPSEESSADSISCPNAEARTSAGSRSNASRPLASVSSAWRGLLGDSCPASVIYTPVIPSSAPLSAGEAASTARNPSSALLPAANTVSCMLTSMNPPPGLATTSIRLSHARAASNCRAASPGLADANRSKIPTARRRVSSDCRGWLCTFSAEPSCRYPLARSRRTCSFAGSSFANGSSSASALRSVSSARAESPRLSPYPEGAQKIEPSRK